MIFQLLYMLIMSGYSACGLLLGSYMVAYTGASSLDLGFVFMLQPFTIFARPFICGHADRHQNHKSLLCKCLLLTSMAYLPFIVIPYCLEWPQLRSILTPRLLFWLFSISHLLGSVGFCGIRSLGDALAVNYAKRIGTDYTIYRKYGSMSFGLCAYLLGLINQGWVMPDFVPTMILYSVSMFVLMILVHLWPHEYFRIIPEGKNNNNNRDQQQQQLEELPVGWDILRHMKRNLHRTALPRSLVPKSQADMKAAQMEEEERIRRHKAQLSMKQQVIIFWLLLRRDYRIPIFLLLLTYVGLVGYAPQNFVFTYMNEVCREKGTCDGAALSGLVMGCYCLLETSCYLVINALKRHINYGAMLIITMASLTFHYYFYGFILPHVSTYFFLIECLHGLEYSTTLASSIELGYRFGNEVELLIPELIERQIISKNDDLELVSLSLMATMSGCFTLVHDGIGTIIGAFVYGLLIDTYSFTTTFIVVGSMAAIGLVAILLGMLLGKLLNLQPRIKRQTSAVAQI